MSKRVNPPSSGRLAELDLVSYGRRGRHTPLQFTPAQLGQIGRTVSGVPEVMVKVSGGGKSADAVQAHFTYIDRHGKLEVHTDEVRNFRAKRWLTTWSTTGTSMRGKDNTDPDPRRGEKDRRPKQVHNIVLSMPARTPAEKLLAATQKFARGKLALEHRYAMVLHTDQGHPHVHLVVKAQNEDGQRLHIRKATLREWREDFAGYLRELGVAANATPLALRGKPKDRKKDGIYRAVKRGRSTFLRRKVERVAEELQHGGPAPEAGKAKLLATRERVVEDWSETKGLLRDLLRAQRQESLAREVEVYVRRMPAVATEKELLAKGLLAQVAVQCSRVRSAEREHSIEDRAR